METRKDINHGNKINFRPIPEELNVLGKQIVDSAYTVHKNLGPGLLEKIYEICFCYELEKEGLNTQGRLKYL